MSVISLGFAMICDGCGRRSISSRATPAQLREAMDRQGWVVEMGDVLKPELHLDYCGICVGVAAGGPAP